MRHIWLIIIPCVFIVLIYFFTTSEILTPSNKPTPSLAPTPSSLKILIDNSQIYTYNIIKITSPDSIKIINNLSDKVITSELMSLHSCIAGINGGFYTPAGESLGLLVKDGQVLSSRVKSSLLNGFLNFSDPPVISHSPPIDPDNAIQNGPLLFLEGQPQLLNIKNDEPARRVIALITKDNQLVFATIYNRDSLFSGPPLSDLPQILSLLVNQEKINIKSALNLDGGSASAFYNDDIRLQELTTVGTFICIN